MSDEKPDEERQPHEVLSVFGVKLTVYNPRLAELLTTEASEALSKDVMELVKGTPGQDEDDVDLGSVLSELEAPTEALGESPLDEIGSRLGFNVHAGDEWRSPTGVIIVVEGVDTPLDVAQATEAVLALQGRQRQVEGQAGGLFVVDDQMGCDVFRVAIRKENLYSEMRVISADNLEQLVAMRSSGRLSHRQVVLLLVPLANIDVGELLNVLRAVHGESTEAS